MSYNPANPLIIQSDKTILLEAASPLYEEARDALARFAELEKSPEHIHTYRITPLSRWNAASSGYDADYIVTALERLAKYGRPGHGRTDGIACVSRYGRVKLVREGEQLLLVCVDPGLMVEIEHHRQSKPYLLGRDDA